MLSPEQALAAWKDQPQDMRLVVQDVLGSECIVQTPAGIPQFLYRYLSERDFADQAVEYGKVRLGTLYGYLSEEGHNSAQHDPNEGIIYVVDDDLRGATDAPVGRIITSLDRWTLCLSEELSPELMSGFEAEAVLEVDMEPFVETLAVEMARHSSIGSLDSVRYVTDNFRSLKNVPDAGRMAHSYKTSAYAWQKEWRLCFEARGAHARSVQFSHEFDRFGNRRTFNDRSFWEACRTNGAFGQQLAPLFAQSSGIADAVRDVTHLIDDRKRK